MSGSEDSVIGATIVSRHGCGARNRDGSREACALKTGGGLSAVRVVPSKTSRIPEDVVKQARMACISSSGAGRTAARGAK